MTITTILGAGAMGTACACVLADHPDVSVRLWARNPEYANEIRRTRRNQRLLPNAIIPESVDVTADAQAALDGSEVILICIPTRGLREAMAAMRSFLPSRAMLISSIKGLETETLQRPSQIIKELAGDRPVVVLGGPCHAEEITARKPASVVAACERIEAAEQVQTLFSTSYLRVYANTDEAGVELSAALKNVIAIAAGICDGLQLGDNAKAALMTRGLAEMVRFGAALGASPETFYGLAGVGDLFTTCSSRHSRNRAVGERLGRGETLTAILESMSAVAEGVFTARSVVRFARQLGIDMPISRQVAQVLFEGKSPREATEELMQRPLKLE